jgi:hypothetical protein
MKIEIGKIYKIALEDSYLLRKVTHTSPRLAQRYPTYGHLQGKRVIVLSKGPGTSLKVGLLQPLLNQPLVGFWLTLGEKWLAPQTAQSTQIPTCKCSMKILMCQGCQCGAFSMEKFADSLHW